MLEAFFELVRDRPGAIAMDTPQLQLTVRALHSKAEEFATLLSTYSVTSGDIFPIESRSGVYPIWESLGCWIVGAIPVVLPAGEVVGHPQNKMGDWSALSVRTSVRERAEYFRRTEVMPWGCLSAAADAMLASPDCVLAYARFSSGSNGSPLPTGTTMEGLRITARGLHESIYEDHASVKRVGLWGNYDFDTCVKQLLQLFQGRTLVPCPASARLSPSSLVQWIRKSKVDIVDLPPSMARVLMLLPAFRALDDLVLLIGGESMDSETWRNIGKAFPGRAYSLYGLTECSADSFCAPISAESEPSLGSPFPGVRWALRYDSTTTLDRDARSGTAGELLLGGPQVGVALNSIVAGRQSNADGVRWFETGDLVELIGGTLVYRGRTQSRLKVRGRWVDMEKVRTSICEMKYVEDVAIVAGPTSESPSRLTAIVATSLERDEFARTVQALNPEVDEVVCVEELRRTTRGKLDIEHAKGVIYGF